MKKSLALILAVILLISAGFTACGRKSDTKENDNPDPDITGSADAVTGGPIADYNGNDISREVNLVVYVIGDEPVLADEVEVQINKIMKQKLNCTLDINYISLSDYTTKYSLLLAGGEPIDIIYTSTWAFYTEEATKGAFLEITDDLIQKYMPLTCENQDSMSFEQSKIKGKCYMITKNSPYVNNAVPVLIRGDLKEKYNIDKIDSIDGLEAYYEAIAQNEEGIYPYAAAGDGVEMSMNLFQSANNMIPSTALGKYFGYFYTGKEPVAEDMVWEYGTEQYLNYCKLVKSWADKGFWSKNAVSNTLSPSDAFINGTSASLFWNIDTCESVKNTVDNDHPDWKAELVNITPGAVHVKGVYTGDGMAIPAVSENYERALMALDLMKNDKEIYDISRYGIEGDTYIATSDTTYKLGSGQANYTVGNAPLSWGIKNDKLERITGEAGAEKSEIRRELFDDAISEISSGFVFDDSAVKSEIAAIDEAASQYIPLLELGLADDVEGTLNVLNSMCEKAGMKKVFDEFKKQFSEYAAGLN